jgi:hypothetical protein
MKKKKMQKRGPAGDGRKIRIISVFWRKKKDQSSTYFHLETIKKHSYNLKKLTFKSTTKP